LKKLDAGKGWKSMRTAACLVLLIVLLPSPGRAEVYRDAGAAAYQFLKIEISPRASALGGTILLNSDIYGVMSSPASVASVQAGTFAVAHGEYFGSVVQNCVGLVQRIDRLTVSCGISSVSAGDLELREEATSEPEGTFSCWNVALAGGVAIHTRGFDLGLSGKLIREKIWRDGSWGFTVDAGATARPAPWLEAAAAVLNLGPSVEYATYESFRMPLTIRAGARATVGLPVAGATSLTAELFKPIDNRLEGAFGLEASPFDWLSLRTGVHAGDDARGFTAGAGLEAGGWSFDYAWIPGRYALGDIHRVSLSRCL
jgi:hypothetical protein